jgi:hypothetical protein
MSREVLKVIGLRIVLGIVFFIISSSNINANAYSTLSFADGSWTDAGNWDSYPGCCILTGPGAGHTYTINGKIRVGSISTTQDLELDKGQLTVNDTLIIYGNLIIGNNGNLTLSDGAVCIVYGSVSIANQVDIQANAYFVIMGDFTKTGSASNGSFTSNDQPANVFISGTVTTPTGWADSGANDVLNCDLATEHDSSGCNYGTAPDLANSPIYNIVGSNCESVSAASSMPVLCVNTSLTDITHTTAGITGIGTAIGLPAGVTATWASDVITISGTPTESGTFNYSIPLTGGCEIVSATGTITVNALPVVSFSGLDSVCQVTDPPFMLSGIPSGGLFSGNGIIGTQFGPTTAGLGTHEIIYTYTNANSCVNADTQYIDVRDYDEQAGAIWITDLNSWCSSDAQYTNSGASADGIVPACWTGGVGNNVWFQFVATTNAVTVDIATGGSYGSMRGQQIAIWNKNNELVKCVNAADWYSGNLSLSIDTLTVGSTYWISVDDRRTHGTFTLCVDSSPSFDYKSGAIEISDINNYCSGDAAYSNAFMTADELSPSCWTGGTGNNVWFKFTALSMGIYVEVKTGGAYGTMRGQQIALWNESGDLVKCVNAADWYSGTISLSVDTLNIGNTYYISVDDRRTHGTFTLCVDNSISYDYQAGAVVIGDINNYQSADAEYSNSYMTIDGNTPSCWTGGVGNNVWFEFVAESEEAQVDVLTGGTYGTMRGQQIALWNQAGGLVKCANAADWFSGTLSLQVDTLTNGATYWISVDDRRTNGTFTLYVDNEVSYDYKIGAEYLIDIKDWSSANAEYSNVYMTADEGTPSCWTGGVGNNVWFMFESETPSISVSVTTGGAYGTMRGQQIAIWNESNELVGCANAADWYAGTLTLSVDTLTVGQYYYISVDDRRTNGTFTLAVDDHVPFDYKSGADLLLDVDHWCSSDAAYNNTYATPDESDPSCWTGGTGNNVWFEFVAISGEIEIDVNTGGTYGTMRGQQIALWNETGTEVGCVNSNDWYAGTLTLTADTLTAGNTYYISVDDRRTHGAFTLCVNNKAGYDFQAGATVIPHTFSWCSALANYSNTYATADGNDPSCWTGGVGNNVWFKFTATTSELTFDVITGGSNGTMRGQQIAVWNEDGNLVKCANAADWYSGTLSLSIDTLTVGNDYYVSVDDRRTHGTFSICISNEVDYDYKKGAIELTGLSEWSSSMAAYQNTYATSDETAGSCWTGGTDNNVWFKFAATTNSIHIDVTTGGTNGTMRGQQIALWREDGTEAGCVNAADWYSGVLSLSIDTLTIGDTYYISVDDRRTHGTFTLGIDDSPSYDFKQGAILLTDLDNWTSALAGYENTYATPDETAGSCWTGGTDNNVWFKFVAISGEFEARVITGGSYGTMRGQQVALWNESGTEIQCMNADDWYSGTISTTIDTLTPGNTYYISVDDRRTHGTFTLYVNNKAGFDFKSGAVGLTDLDNWCSTDAEYTNRYATAGGNSGSCWSGTSDANVWFTFEALFDTLTVQVITGGSYGTMRGQQISVWNSGNVEVGCANAADWFSGTLTLQIDTLTPGHTYWITVDERRTSGSFSLCVNNVSGIDYWAIADGNWNTIGNWSRTEGGPAASSVPGSANKVHIKGYSVTVTDDQSCANIYVDIENSATALSVDGGILHVNGDLNFTNPGANYTGNVNLLNSGILNVQNDLLIDRAGGNSEFKIELADNSAMNINNDASVSSSGGSTANVEIILNSSSGLNVSNDLFVTNAGGPKIILTGNNNSIIDIGRHIVFNAPASDQAEIELNNDAFLYIAGNFTRGSSFGILDCNDNATLVFDGQSYIQTLPQNAGSGTDEFTYQNITINNTKITTPQVVLDGTVSVSGTLSLIQGIVRSTSANLLTIEDNASVAGASSASYVNGVLRKIGDDAFTFDIGDDNYYKPISISAPSSITDGFEAQYFNTAPHPTYDSTLHDASLTYINKCEYWTLERTSGSSSVNATLFWDANSCCISNLSDLKVAVWDGSQWKDHGNNGTTGTTVAGTIISGTSISGTFNALTLANSLPIVSFTGLASSYCESDGDVVLAGLPNDDIQDFSGPGITSNGDGTGTFSPSAAGAGIHVITYTYTNTGSGCSNSTSQYVTVYARPTSSMLGTDSVCPGTSSGLSIFFTGTSPWDYTYTDGTTSFTGTTSDNPYEFLATNAGTYFVTSLQDANGCVANEFGDTAIISEYPAQAKPIITPSGATTFCEGNTVTLTSSASATFYYWSNGETSQDVIIDESGKYYVKTRDAHGCLSEWSDTIEIVVNPLPGKPAPPSGDNSICQYSGTEIYTTSGAADAVSDEYVWTLDPPIAGSVSGNTTSATVTWDNSFTGTATIKVQGHNSCGYGPESNALSITVNSAPLVDLGLDRNVCGSETLDAENSGSNYLWSTGATSQTLVASSSGAYWVKVTSGNGCIDRDTVTLTVGAALTITTQPVSQTETAGTNVTLTVVVSGSGPYTYQWQKGGSDLSDVGNISGSASSALTISNAQTSDTGNYTCIVSSLCGNVTSDTAVITINACPVTGPLYHPSNSWGN